MNVNIERPDFDEPREHEGFRAQRARLSRQPSAVPTRDYYDGESPPD